VVLVSPSDISSPAIRTIFQGIASRDEQSELLATDNINETLSERIPRGDSIIVLGQLLIDEVAAVDRAARIIGGAFYGVASNPADIPTLSLEPSLDTIVSDIRKTGFTLTRLRTVVATNNTIFTNAPYTKASDDLNVVLSPVVAKNEQEFARNWFSLLQEIDSSNEAIVIIDEKYLDSSGAYRNIIETAWRKDILVVSTLPNYSRRGVSIGYVPDLFLYGARLYDQLTDPDSTQSATDAHTLWTDATLLNRVFNQRTLMHIGYRLPNDLDRLNGIDLVIE
jgi:hypothetical protein